MIQLLALTLNYRTDWIHIRFAYCSSDLFLFQEIIFDIIRSPITHAVDDRS
jgi:hypothetical protein